MNILEEAEKAVYGDRNEEYGHPKDDFARIAKMWNAYMVSAGLFMDQDAVLLPRDVSAMMMLLKMCRLIHNPGHRDSLVDIAGYAETWARCEGIDQ